MASRYGWIRGPLQRSRVNGWIIALAMALLAPCLDTGLSADDYVHKLILSQSGEIKGFIRPAWDLFRFTREGSIQQLKQEGVLSWWDDPKARLAFWRPLSAITHYLDHLLWPDSPTMMHLHSMLWALIVYLGIRTFYKELISPAWVASLALLLYVIDDARAWFGSWVAARNAVVATAFSVWALAYHHRYLTKGRRLCGISAAFCFATALLSGEGSISVCAYLFAYALFIDGGRLRARLARLLPYVLIAIAWRVAYVTLAYGVIGSGLYTDPLKDPGQFTRVFFEHAPILWFSQWAGIWSDLWTSFFVFPRFSKAIMTLAVAFITLCAILFFPLLRRDRLVRFALLGALLSTLPASATFTSDRLLPWIAIGACIALARFIALYIDDPGQLRLSTRCARVAPAMVMLLIISNIIVAPVLLVSRARGGVALREILDRADRSVPVDKSISDKLVIYLNPAGVPLASYIPVTRAALGVPRPKAQYWLATSTTQVRIDRRDARTLKVRPRDGFLLNPADKLLRSPQRPLALGERIDLADIDIRVSAITSDQRPAEITVRFSTVLEDPSILWLCWNRVRYIGCNPPAIGEHMILPAVDFLEVILGKRTPIKMRYTPKESGPLWSDG
ncbi:MAG: hypothetical protein JXA30_21970 [Deltaproteobacteria bacterium]|nr:hypothetical protein [Deltaproteobacteria bacterium]